MESHGVDLVVGLATYNCARTAPRAAEAVRAGLAGPSAPRWRVVVADGGSTDGTPDRVREALKGSPFAEVSFTPESGDVLGMPFHGLPGRARALAAILRESRSLGARGCVVIDTLAARRSPEAVVRLASPVVAGDVDFLAPRYARHPFSGALVHGVLYPMFRALYGARLREPMAGDIACSATFIDAVIDHAIWQTDSGQVGIDLWLSASAVSGGFRIGQTPLEAVLHEERGEPDLGSLVAQTLGALFADMERRVEAWQRTNGSRPVREMGAPLNPSPARPEVDAAHLVDSFRLGHRELQDVWAEVMPPLATLQWRRLASGPLEAFRVDDALWARTLYDFAMGHRLGVIARGHLLRSLVPLYLGWLGSFVLEMGQATASQAEDRIERLCLAFESEKPYLISMWRWPERFKPVRIRR